MKQNKKDIQSVEKSQNIISQQLKILQQVFYPDKIKKQLKSIFVNTQKKQDFTLFISQHDQKSSKIPNVCKKYNAICLLLYAIYTNKTLSVSLSSYNKRQLDIVKDINSGEKNTKKGRQKNKVKSKDINKTKLQQQISQLIQDKQNIEDSVNNTLFKDKKYTNFFQLLTQKIHKIKQQNHKSQTQYNLVIEQIKIQLLQYNRTGYLVLMNFVSTLFFVISKINQSNKVKIKKFIVKFQGSYWDGKKQNNITLLSQKLGSKQKLDIGEQPDVNKNQINGQVVVLNKDCSEIEYVFSYHYWKFVYQIGNIDSITLKIPFLSDMIQSLNIIDHKILNQKLLAQNKTNQASQQQLSPQQFQNTYCLQICLSTNPTINNKQQTSLDFIVNLIKKLPNLKVLIIKHEQSSILLVNNSYIFFDAISKYNVLLENLILSGIKIKYSQQGRLNARLFGDGNWQKQSSQQKIKSNIILPQQSSNIENIDINLNYLQKMQQNCPFLNFVQINFLQKDKNQQRRLLQQQRKQYQKKIQKTKSIINKFYKRGMNIQTYFNSIKILQSQQFDYQTILGIMDKIDPFAPI